MDVGINNVIYMELYSGPKMANGSCGKTIDTGTIDRGSTVPWLTFLDQQTPNDQKMTTSRSHIVYNRF